MILWWQVNKTTHKDHTIALTQLLKTARECNVRLNYNKLQYKSTEVNFFSKPYTIDGQKPLQSKVKVIKEIPPPQSKKTSAIPYRDDQLYLKVLCLSVKTHRADT